VTVKPNHRRLPRVLLAAVALASAAIAAGGCSKDEPRGEAGATTAVASAPPTAVSPEAAPAASRPGLRAMREKFDRNGDGRLDESERAAMRQERAARLVERYDRDRNGLLSQEEIAAVQGRGRRALADASTADTDRDGSLSAAELASAMASRRGSRASSSTPPSED
jgi:hypothetical protein